MEEPMIERIEEMPPGTVGLQAWVRDHSAWKRFAPFEPGELEEAKAWVAG
jgi:hypothetical protein